MTAADVWYLADSGVLTCEDCAEPGAELVSQPGETDSPSHCDGCGVLLEQDLTDDGCEYVKTALGEYIHAHVFGGYGGTASVLDAWRAEYGSTLDADKLLSVFDGVREREQFAKTVVLAEWDGGYGREYGTDIDGAAWTTFEQDDAEGLSDCAVCGVPVWDGWHCMDGGDVVCDEHVTRPKDVRETASSWHGGQSSALYALASSGIVSKSARYELRRELHTLDAASRPTTMTSVERRIARRELRAALVYVDAKTGHPADSFIVELHKQASCMPAVWNEDDTLRMTRIVCDMLKRYGLSLPS